jgi:hypothetical protein
MHEASLQPLDTVLLGQIGDLNWQLLELLAATARGAPTGLASPVIQELRDQWQRLSPEALQRLSACPYPLLELVPAGPKTAIHWPSPPSSTAIHEPGPAARHPAPREATPNPLADLTRRALLMGWHYAQTRPMAARITLGLRATEFALLAALPLPGLERLAADASRSPRLRWEDRLEIWRQLLGAAADGDPRRLRQMQLRGLQLLAAQDLR